MKRSAKTRIAELESTVEFLTSTLDRVTFERDTYREAVEEEWRRQDMLNFLRYRKG